MLSATDALTETQGMYVGISAMQAGMKTQAFDVCMANVLEGDMQRLRMRLLSYLKPGGLFILSGMLTDQVNPIAQCFRDCECSADNPCPCACAISSLQ